MDRRPSAGSPAHSPATNPIAPPRDHDRDRDRAAPSLHLSRNTPGVNGRDSAQRGQSPLK